MRSHCYKIIPQRGNKAPGQKNDLWKWSDGNQLPEAGSWQKKHPHAEVKNCGQELAEL